MATLRAIRATDMRDGVVEDGFVIEADRTSVVIADGETTGTFSGSFIHLRTNSLVGGGFYNDTLYGYPFEPVLPSPAWISGVIESYEQRDGFLRNYSVSGLTVEARPVFTALARGDIDFFNKVVFAGRDLLLGSRDDDVLMGYGSSDTLRGFDGDDKLKGGRGADLIYGDDGSDKLNGNKGRDNLRGGDDADRLFGGQANDFLHGDNGADLLVGGLGQDQMSGGGGDDVFRFNDVCESKPGSDHRDRIRDFDPGEDLVDLSRIDANETQSGDQPFIWIGAGAFSGAAGQLRYDDGRLQGDTTGDGRADFEVAFSDDPILGPDDFLL